MGRRRRGLLQPKGACLLHGGQHLLEQHGEGRVGRQVQAVEAGVGSAVTTTSLKQFQGVEKPQTIDFGSIVSK